jgi:hypothetical protein
MASTYQDLQDYAKDCNLTEKTRDKLSDLVAENYAIDDIIDFIETYGEDTFVKRYEDYIIMGERMGYEIVDAFVDLNGIDYIDEVKEAYVGKYESEAHFAESFYEETVGAVPDGLYVNWQKTWDCNYSVSFDYNDGYVFRK